MLQEIAYKHPYPAAEFKFVDHQNKYFSVRFFLTL